MTMEYCAASPVMMSSPYSPSMRGKSWSLLSMTKGNRKLFQMPMNCSRITVTSAGAMSRAPMDREILDSEPPSARCPCREPRPCRSGGMLVLVQDAAEAIAPSYVEVGPRARIGDLCGQRVQRAGVRDALVRTVSIVELLEFA